MRVEIERLYDDEHGFTRVLGWALSESRPGLRHGVYVLLDPSGRVLRALCDCESFVYRKSCKHVEWVRGEVLRRAGRVGGLASPQEPP
jgi:hypothetical protein